MACATGSPSTCTCPAESGTKPMTALNSVDLPLPLTPTSAVMLPAGVSKLASRKAVWPLA